MQIWLFASEASLTTLSPRIDYNSGLWSRRWRRQLLEEIKLLVQALGWNTQLALSYDYWWRQIGFIDYFVWRIVGRHSLPEVLGGFLKLALDRPASSESHRTNLAQRFGRS